MNFRKGIVFLLLSTSFVSQLFGQGDTLQHIEAGRMNAASQIDKPYVILVSADGFRADYRKKYNAINLQRMAREGAHTEYMLSSYPSLTFPNHYTLITGLYPAHHGLVDNTFYDASRSSVYNMHDVAKVTDGSWYGGTPLWVLAEQQGMLTASFYWVGSDANIKGIHPTYYFNYNELIRPERRLQILKEWLELPAAERPHLITIYFPEVDHAAHTNGTRSEKTEEAVKFIDTSVGQIRELVTSLKLQANIILVSDHGMTDVDVEHTIPIPAILNDTTVCKLIAGATMLHVHMTDPSNIPVLYNELKKMSSDFDVYLAKDVPASWHYAQAEDTYRRVGDILVVSKFPRIFQVGKKPATPGKHGFDPAAEDMHATFIAWGPQIVPGAVVPPFENVNLYPMIAKLLGLTYSDPIDGDEKVLAPVLRK